VTERYDDTTIVCGTALLVRFYSIAP